ncbi:MAG: hypothetical protein KKD07_08765 [Candidatus Omnitrophica bacterium]|nr:hypothetical protein [Candidatus Omnitrophota bacterium]MBU1997153.1 hypothetical protein [Candidatus Omnitrophota bacterium]MBU4334517.1 hypothetical protein [Candidatus Omnitrophota bacterium]
MSDHVLSKAAIERIKKIHSASALYNEKAGKEHNQRLLELIRHHVEEIKELNDANDRHFLVETGDLAVLCFELMLEHQESIDDIMLKCFDRYDKKLASLLNEEAR